MIGTALLLLWCVTTSRALLAPTTKNKTIRPFLTTATARSTFGLLRYRSSAVDDDMKDVSRKQPAVNGEHADAAAATRIHPSQVGFAPSSRYHQQVISDPHLLQGYYPYATMMQGSAPYIANHAGQIAVFHLPGELLDNKKATDQLLNDIGLVWLLGMKIVLVVSSRYSEYCDVSDSAHECHNSLMPTDEDTLRRVEEEAGYLRTEVERKLNKYLRFHGDHEGNVVSGNFYTAKAFGQIRGQDFGATGYAKSVNVAKIHKVLDNNDVCLLTTVGSSKLGDAVHTNGYHLAAQVASEIKALKLIYMSNEGTLLQRDDGAPIQELDMDLASSIAEYHQVQVHDTGFATFEPALESLDGGAVELLLHLAWSSYALERGVERAHIVNPGDGALLEELFTSKNGANTCVMKERIEQDEEDPDWDSFFANAEKKQVGGEGRDNSKTAFR